MGAIELFENPDYYRSESGVPNGAPDLFLRVKFFLCRYVSFTVQFRMALLLKMRVFRHVDRKKTRPFVKFLC